MMDLVYVFLLGFVVVMFLGLIPSLVSEERLHDLVTRLYLSDKSNLDRIYEELDAKNFLVEDYFVNDYQSLTNCTCVYYFVEPVTVVFDIDSSYTGCQTVKEYHRVVVLTVFALNGDIECQVTDVDNGNNSVFLFDDTHRLKFCIVSEE